MIKHVVICDKCKKEENLVSTVFKGYQLPPNWSKTDAGQMCSDCIFIYRDKIMEFKGK